MAGAGVGGLGQGRGDAVLSVGDPNDPFKDEAFQSKRLTPAEYATLDRSTLVGVGIAAPAASGQTGESAGTAAPTSPSTGATAWKRRIDPRHRRAVSKFFDR